MRVAGGGPVCGLIAPRGGIAAIDVAGTVGSGVDNVVVGIKKQGANLTFCGVVAGGPVSEFIASGRGFAAEDNAVGGAGVCHVVGRVEGESVNFRFGRGVATPGSCRSDLPVAMHISPKLNIGDITREDTGNG